MSPQRQPTASCQYHLNTNNQQIHAGWVCIHTYKYISCTYTCVYIYIYTYIHTHIYAQRNAMRCHRLCHIERWRMGLDGLAQVLYPIWGFTHPKWCKEDFVHPMIPGSSRIWRLRPKWWAPFCVKLRGKLRGTQRKPTANTQNLSRSPLQAAPQSSSVSSKRRAVRLRLLAGRLVGGNDPRSLMNQVSEGEWHARCAWVKVHESGRK